MADNRKGFWRNLGRQLYEWQGIAELWTIIPLIEGIMRLWYHLDPRVYFESFRVRRITGGEVTKKSDSFVILVLYARGPLPTFTTNIIDEIERSSLNLVIVCNGKLEDARRIELLGRCHLMIERANLGRDFGAYKDGIRILLQRFSNMTRLILLNDSLFYFQPGLDKLLAGLSGSHEFIGVTEVFEFHYHVQSFILSFGPKVITNKRFAHYWRQYRPISTRRWSIHKGEVGLTRRLTKAGFRPHILFHAAQLMPHLSPLPVRQVIEAVRLLPPGLREEIYARFEQLVGEITPPNSVSAIEAISLAAVEFGRRYAGVQSDNAGAIESISQGVRALVDADGPGGRLGKLPRIGSQAGDLDRWSFQIFANDIVATIAARNQIHAGGFLFRKYLGLPIVKRDIFYREVYPLEELHQILTEMKEPLLDEVMSDLRRGGTATHLRGLQWILYRHGSI